MATQTIQKPARTIADDLAVLKPQIKVALPAGMDEDRFIRTVLTLLQRTPGLMECNKQSILLGVIQSAELGLELGTVMGHAYLVPFKGNATLQIGWRGFIELARRSGIINSIVAEVVYENDAFEIEKGLDQKLVHRPRLKGARGEPIGAYAIAFFKDGFKDFEWMDLDQIEHCRKSSRASRDDSPWNTHWEEMARKTPIRRLCKRLPLSPQDAVLLRAAVMDEYNDSGIDVEPVIPGRLEVETSAGEKQVHDIPKAEEAGDPLMAGITEDQMVALRELAESKKMKPMQLVEFIGKHGYDALSAIPKKDFARIFNELSK